MSRWLLEVSNTMYTSFSVTIVIILIATGLIISCELLKYHMRAKEFIKEQQASTLSIMVNQYSQLISHPMTFNQFLITYQGPVRQGKDIWIELNLQLGFDAQVREDLLSFRQTEIKYLEEVTQFLEECGDTLQSSAPECIEKLKDILGMHRYAIDFTNLHPSRKAKQTCEYYTYEELEYNLKSPLYDAIKDYWAERERRKLKVTKKRNLKKLAGYTCASCHQVLKPGELTIDHIIPVSKWGRSELWNLQVLCDRCNKGKKDVTPDNWKDLVGDYVNSIEDIEPHWIV